LRSKNVSPLSSPAISAPANPPQDDTIEQKALYQREERVTIVDPRHPLFGLTLLLVQVTDIPHLGRYCVVSFRDITERYIPLTVTDRSPEAIVIPSLPLDLSSVRELLNVYQHINSQLMEETEDGNSKKKPNNCSPISSQGQTGVGEHQAANSAQSGLDLNEPGSAAVSEAKAGSHLLQPGQEPERQSRGGE
jgi:hypothetical protein